MAKRKGISISLAAKCQLLFGLAVLVIIAGALAVPWQRMEQLAKLPNMKAARLTADVVLREVHTGLWVDSSASAPAAAASQPGGEDAATQAAAATRPAWDDVRLTDSDYPRPRLFVVKSPVGGLAPWPGAEGDASRRAGRSSPAGGPLPVDPLASEALRRFREPPFETEYGEIGVLKDRGGEPTRVYRYAAPLRLDTSCLRCHEEYRAWLPGGMAAAGEWAATRASASQPATRASRAADALGGGIGPSVPVGAAGGGSAGGVNWPVVGVVRVDVPYQTDENQLLLNRIVIVVAGMLGGALAIVVFYLITSRLILQPVRVLKNTAEKVAKGDLNIRSAISTGDEFQHLSETFNTMLATLKASQDQLEATNRSLDTRVGELAQSNVDLYEANRLKSEFLTNVTHELRTPLNAIIGFADLMADTAKEPKQQRYSENIRTSAKQLLDLINDLLDLAKIEAGKLVLREEKVSVADVCEAMANFMRPLAQKKNISLELSVDPDMPLISTDPGRFQQILYNFLSNAIKFTPADGRVGITARREAPPARVVLTDVTAEAGGAAAAGGGAGGADEVKALRVSITDTGPGISAEDQAVIFDKFRQLDGSVTRQHSGSGLGLTISRELASMLGARIELVSAPGKGATFSLVIPLVNPHHTVEVHATLENA